MHNSCLLRRAAGDLFRKLACLPLGWMAWLRGALGELSERNADGSIQEIEGHLSLANGRFVLRGANAVSKVEDSNAQEG